MFAFFKHLHTVNKHRFKVCVHCFKAGIPLQGLVHDLSKYSPAEFISSVRFYQGTRSPNEAEREKYGYSKAWLHHKGRNKHHFEYWTDVDVKTKIYHPVPMPMNYLAELICDRIAASKTYKGKDYTNACAYDYFTGHRAREMMHPESAKFTEEMLLLLKEKGEDEMFSVLRSKVKEYKKTEKHRK